MNRSEFLYKCGLGCLAFSTGTIFLNSCSVKMLQAAIVNDEIRLLKNDFRVEDKEKFHRYVIVKAAGMNYPIVVYRKDDLDYHSILLRCTHQGTQLRVYGDLISCPAHGSEFSKDGEVLEGPAAQNLKTFVTQVSDKEVIINLT